MNFVNIDLDRHCRSPNRSSLVHGKYHQQWSTDHYKMISDIDQSKSVSILSLRAIKTLHILVMLRLQDAIFLINPMELFLLLLSIYYLSIFLLIGSSIYLVKMKLRFFLIVSIISYVTVWTYIYDAGSSSSLSNRYRRRNPGQYIACLKMTDILSSWARERAQQARSQTEKNIEKKNHNEENSI